MCVIVYTEYGYNIERISKMECRDILLKDVYDILKDVCSYYKEFYNWYYDKVVKDINTNSTLRDIIIATEHTTNNIIAIAIVKKDTTECKICTFYVKEDYRKSLLTYFMFIECFEYLGTTKPLITMSESLVPMFTNYIKMFNFKLVQKLNDYYEYGNIEYVYNGHITVDRR